ncbi:MULTISPECIES: flagellar biosynthetic protein FliR [unclassified Beijerinckia]|uniref:flagellar biosynthetic protein FliR n=1 Tax=unclassified Beijerinckia TaxID=2638183 RepID=UPI00089D24AD|nr:MULTISPECIES: flagellar biosynthetic protein FliR [unclassified Beijerinckia]MDH7798667.1 flagellar biosynthetic protein FliR [Beijerinckia sp. GAS462]SED28655.1 flagellar biosynthetic protein FliR [Beijerinckia sp. 28-YEA-48]
MTALGADIVLVAMVVFCRIGACLMIMPGFSSPRVPIRVRLFIALGVTLALTPMLMDTIRPAVPADADYRFVGLLVSETLIGGMIGVLGRCFFGALETMGAAAGMAIGISNNVGAPINEDEPLSPLAALMMFAATMLMFATDLHLELFRALVSSYATMPVSEGFHPRSGLVQVTSILARAFVIALQLCSPFIIFGIIINLAFGLLNKLTPQVPVYFLALPFTLAGGLILFLFTGKYILSGFIQAFGSWLSAG